MSTETPEQVLKNLSLNELIMLLEKLLPFEGFGDVDVQGRRKTKQKSTYGGFELRCRTKIGNQAGTVLVKVMATHPLNTRMIHELAGCVVEHDALLGLLVSPLNRSASRAFVQALHPKLRVRVLDAPELIRLLKCSGLGVLSDGAVDDAFFANLKAASNMVLETIDVMKVAYR